MASIRSDSTARLVGALFGEGSAAGMTDEQLLERFVARRDAAAEYAFEALVQRHGPMVLGVCRNWLRDRLARRGLEPAGLAALPLASRAEPLAASLAAQTARAALDFASRTALAPGPTPTQVTAIALGVLKTMSIKRITIGMAVILG